MISSVEMGRRIGQARKERGLTQDALARAVGLGRTTLVAVEKGERPPTDAEIVQIAETLGIETHALVSEHASMGAPSPRFRMPPAARRVGPAVDAGIARLLGLARKYAELENIHQLRRVPAALETLQVYRKDISSAGETYEEARTAGEEAALTARAILRLGEGPVADLAGVLEREAGLRIFHLGVEDGMPAPTAALFIWSDELGGCIAINAGMPVERQRHLLAHELGRFLRNREEGDVQFEGQVFRREPSEGFAERFATCFLLPESSLRRDIAALRRADGLTVAGLVALASAYGTSLNAAMLRLAELGLLPRSTCDRIAAAIKARNAQVTPPLPHGEQGAFARFPMRYRTLVVRAHEAELLSEGEAAAFLETDRLAFRDIVQRAHVLDDGQSLEMSLAEILDAP